MKKFFTVLCVIVAFAWSCEKDDTLYYNNQTIGNFVNGQFFTDEGLLFNFVENSAVEGMDTLKRAFVICDILRKVSDTEYDVRLHQIFRVLTKDYLPSYVISDEESIGNDPVKLNYGWFTSDYINMNISVTYLEGSETSHLINLVYDYAKSSADTLCFNLRHNGYGEVYGKYEGDGKLGVASSIVSFPIKPLIPLEKNSIVVKVNYEWYLTAAGVMVTDTWKESITGVMNRRK